MFLAYLSLFFIATGSLSRDHSNRSRKVGSKYFDLLEGSQKIFQKTTQQRLNVIMMSDLMTADRIGDFKVAAKSLLKSFLDGSKFSVIICDSGVLKTVEMTSRETAIALVVAAQISTTSLVTEGCEKAKTIAKKDSQNTKVYLLTSDLKKVNGLSSTVKIFTEMGTTFSIFLLDDPSEGVLYVHESSRNIIYYLPRFVVPFGILQRRWSPEWDKIKVLGQVKVDVVTDDRTILAIVGELQYSEFGFTNRFPMDKFRNLEFDEEGKESNTEFNSVFPQNDNRVSKLQMYARYTCVKCVKLWITLRMNDYGLEPDSIESDLYYTTALYCRDLQNEGLHNTEFLVKYDNDFVGKIFDGTAFRVEKIKSKCLRDEIPPARISNYIKLFIGKGFIYCVFVAVGNDGMRGLLSFYETKSYVLKSGTNQYFNYTSKAKPFSILCLNISNPNFTLGLSILLEIQPVDESNNTPGWSNWVFARRGDTLPSKVCAKKLDNNTNDRKNSATAVTVTMMTFVLTYFTKYFLF